MSCSGTSLSVEILVQYGEANTWLERNSRVFCCSSIKSRISFLVLLVYVVMACWRLPDLHRMLFLNVCDKLNNLKLHYDSMTNMKNAFICWNTYCTRNASHLAWVWLSSHTALYTFPYRHFWHFSVLSDSPEAPPQSPHLTSPAHQVHHCSCPILERHVICTLHFVQAVTKKESYCFQCRGTLTGLLKADIFCGLTKKKLHFSCSVEYIIH